MSAAPRRVFLASAFAGSTRRNRAYALAALRECLAANEAPLAVHLLYPLVLDDHVPEERAQGIAAGLAWAGVAEALVAFVDLGVSPGMQAEIARARELGIPVEFRTVPGWSWP